MSEVATQQKQWNPQIVVGAYSFEQKLELAQKMARAKVFPGVEDEFKALAAIEIGEYLGMSPAEALMSIEFGAQGKPSVSIHWQAAQLQKLGWKWDFIEHTASTCHMQFFPPDDRSPFKMQFTADEARAIQVYDKTQNNGKGGATLGNKWNYRSWMSDMLYAFVMRRVVKHYEPKVLGGIASNEDQDADEQIQVGVYEGHKPTAEEAQQAIGETFGESATGKHPPVKPLDESELADEEKMLDEIRADFMAVVSPLLNASQRGDLCRKVFGLSDFKALKSLSFGNLYNAMPKWREEIAALKTGGIDADDAQNGSESQNDTGGVKQKQGGRVESASDDPPSASDDVSPNLEEICHALDNALSGEAIRKRAEYRQWCKQLDLARAAISNGADEATLDGYRSTLADILAAVEEHTQPSML